MEKAILLVNSFMPAGYKIQNRYVPLGLMYLASALSKSGYGVILKDTQNETLGMTDEEIEYYLNNTFESYLKTISPDFIGINVIFSARFKSALKIAKIIKKVFENSAIALGGAHPTLFANLILNEYSYIDYIVMGEGEVSFIKLLDSHFYNKILLDRIDGIAYRKDGKIFVNSKTEYIKNLDSLPFPDYEVLNIKDYYLDTSKWYNPKELSIRYNFPIITSRGCPNSCTYCALKFFHGNQYRIRSAENIVDEIEYLYTQYNCNYISFIDDNLTFSKKRTLEIMTEICKRKLNIQFDTSNGIQLSTIDEQVLEAMVRAGLVRTTVAIETGSQFIRSKVLKKNLKNETIYKFFEIAKKYKDLRFVAFFMCGYPQETKETLNETFEMIKNLPLDDISFNILIPFFGTDIFKYAYQNKLLDVDLENLHNNSDFTYEDKFFIKPYQLDISYIRDFRHKVLEYVEGRRASLKSQQ